MRHLEDFTPGDRIPLPSAGVTEADIVAFARQFDPQPMHIDPAAAASGRFGGIIASGWHTISLVMRLIVESRLFDGAPVLGLGVDEMRWPTPVRPGDRITGDMEVVSVTPSASKPTHGILRIHVTARNQKGETVLSMFPNLWVPRAMRRTAAEGALFEAVE